MQTPSSFLSMAFSLENSLHFLSKCVLGCLCVHSCVYVCVHACMCICVTARVRRQGAICGSGFYMLVLGVALRWSRLVTAYGLTSPSCLTSLALYHLSTVSLLF